MIKKIIKGLSIRFKLLGAFLVISFFVIGTSYINILQQRSVSNYRENVYQSHARTQAFLHMKNVASELSTEIITMLDFMAENNTQIEANSVSDKKYKILANLELLNKWKNEYKKYTDGDNINTYVAFIDEMDILQSTIIDTVLEYISLKEQGISGVLTQNKYQATIDSVDALKKKIDNTVAKELRNIEDSVYVSDISEKKAVAVNYIISFLSVLIACILGIFLNNRIVGPVRKMRDAVLHIIEGDLTQIIDIKTHDELGDLSSSFNSMTIKLKESSISLAIQMKETEKKSIALQNQVTETEKSKLAVLNLLEDIEEEKKKVEGVVVERTRELSEEKARLLASINSMPFGFVVVNIKNKIILKNKVIAEMFSFPIDKDLFVEDIAQAIGKDCNLKTSVELCEKGKTTCEIKEITFGSKLLRGIIAPILTMENNEVVGYVFLLEDITEAKILERSKDEFFAVASHELRTPLTAIRGNTEMILDMYADKITDKDVKEMLSDIKEASVRLLGIVNDFLDVSRLEQGKVALQNTEFNLLEIIDKVVKIVKIGAEEKKLTLEFKKEEKASINVFADKDKVQQVLFNLIGNSIKFTLKGSVSILTDISAGFARIRVIDTGPGISVENESLLFRKFQPAGEKILARDVTKSTGLGLYISHLLILKMGGTIGLEKSVVGEGSVFFFTLPLAS